MHSKTPMWNMFWNIFFLNLIFTILNHDRNFYLVQTVIHQFDK